MISVKNILFLNMALLMVYRFLLISAQEPFTKFYFIGYVAAQLPVGYILDLVNPYKFVTFSGLFCFIILSMFDLNAELTYLSGFLLILIGALSASAFQSCIRMYTGKEKENFIYPVVIGQLCASLVFTFLGMRPDCTMLFYNSLKFIYLFQSVVFFLKRKDYVVIKENQNESLLGGFLYVVTRRDLILLFAFTYFACVAMYGYVSPYIINHLVRNQGLQSHFVSQSMVLGLTLSFLIPIMVSKFTPICKLSFMFILQCFNLLFLFLLYLGCFKFIFSGALLCLIIGGITFAETATSVVVFNMVPLLTKKFVTLSTAMMNLATMLGGIIFPVTVSSFSYLINVNETLGFFYLIALIKAIAMLLFLLFRKKYKI